MVRQGTANPPSPVQIRVPPPEKGHIMKTLFCGITTLLCMVSLVNACDVCGGSHDDNKPVVEQDQSAR